VLLIKVVALRARGNAAVGTLAVAEASDLLSRSEGQMKRNYGLIAGSLLLVLAWVFPKIRKREDLMLRIAYPAPWGTIVPAVQHTAIGDSIILNQYEPLVEIGRNGVVHPRSAVGWEVSKDFRIFTFKIDPKKKFSDGTPLLARHFKESWEHGLKLTPLSANSSLDDIFYNVEGFEAFKSTGSLSGVRVIDDHTLQVRFKSPFRIALYHFAGGRFAATLDRDGRLLGTGPLVFEEKSSELILGSRNSFATEQAPFNFYEIKVVGFGKAFDLLKSGSVDAVYFAQRAGLNEGFVESNSAKLLFGQESLHLSIDLNCREGRLLHKRELRLALQSLIRRKIAREGLRLGWLPEMLRLDAQAYLPFQAGRLDDVEVESILKEGDQYIPQLVEATKKHPLYVATTARQDSLRRFLEEAGITVDPRSHDMDEKSFMENFYKRFDADLMFGSFSVVQGDPDGLYHRLGAKGAIASPMQYVQPTAKLLEEGRSIVDMEKLHGHYQKVNRSILESVPFVHLGYVSSIVAYNPQTVKTDDVAIGRLDERFVIFQPK
jgi:ABC-type transport system substrate-binding protein